MGKRIPIATIKLAPGESGYYDEYSRIYLSSANPTAVVYSGTNCSQIKRSIKSGRLRLVSGSFEEVPTALKPELAPVTLKKAPEAQKKEEPKIETPVEEKTPETAPVASEEVSEINSVETESEKTEQNEIIEESGEVEIVSEEVTPKRRRKNRKEVATEA